jgi:hypothetical protein
MDGRGVVTTGEPVEAVLAQGLQQPVSVFGKVEGVSDDEGFVDEPGQ